MRELPELQEAIKFCCRSTNNARGWTPSHAAETRCSHLILSFKAEVIDFVLIRQLQSLQEREHGNGVLKKKCILLKWDRTGLRAAIEKDRQVEEDMKCRFR